MNNKRIQIYIYDMQKNCLIKKGKHLNTPENQKKIIKQIMDYIKNVNTSISIKISS